MIHKHIDHINLKPIATEMDIIQLCNEAKIHNFRAVCVHPCRINLAARRLANSPVKIATVVGFPLGANCFTSKCAEAAWVTAQGIDEIDMVWNLGRFKESKYLLVLEEITRIVEEAFRSGTIVKVIVETCYLDNNEIRKAHQIVKDSGAQYIKTSTGFGANPDDIGLCGAYLPDIITWKHLGGLKIKASGGIKAYNIAKDFIAAGADVIGTSSGVKIVEEEDVFESSSFPNEDFPVS